MKIAKFQRDICSKINTLIKSEIEKNPLLFEYLETGIKISSKKNRKFAPETETGDIVSISCISEAKAKYNANDCNLNENSLEKGALLYSPRIDICITPTITNNNSNRQQQVFNKLINIDRLNFYEAAISNYNKLSSFIQEIESIANNNYIEHFGSTNPQQYNTTKNPLHLVGIELEMSPNLKHLMGDFVNAYILSKHPVVVIKDELFYKAMNMLQYLKVTNEIKHHNLTQLFSVFPLKLSQFIQIVNNAADPSDVQPIVLSHYL